MNETIPLMEAVQENNEDIATGQENVTSVLTLSALNSVNDSGDYTCQAAVNGRYLEPSKVFTLSSDENSIIDLENLVDCDASDSNVYYDSATRCADVMSTAQVVTTPTTVPPPEPSQTTRLTTVTSSQMPLGGTTTIGETMATTQNVETEAPSFVPESLQVWIYVLVGVAAVFFIIIVILTIMCVGLCVRRNKTQDSHTLKRKSLCVWSVCVCVWWACT